MSTSYDDKAENVIRTVSISDIDEFTDMGICAFPINYDASAKIVPKGGHPQYSQPFDRATVLWWLQTTHARATGIAIKLIPPLSMLDFDLKNTDNKNIFIGWQRSFEARAPELLRKIYIEKTRNGGLHVFLKQDQVVKTLRLASSPSGAEVIALKTGGDLGYVSPTPGYEGLHNDFRDIEMLSPEEFDLLTSLAASLDERPPESDLIQQDSVIYPEEYKSVLLKFDACSEEIFTKILGDLGLFPNGRKVRGKFNYDEFVRKGSLSDSSAMVYFSPNRCYLFTTSLPGFPNHANRHEAGGWKLTPSKILFYKHSGNWNDAMIELMAISDSAGIELENPFMGMSGLTVEDKEFPYHVLPEPMLNFLMASDANLRPYMAGAMLVAASAAMGNSKALIANGRRSTPLLYMAVIGPPGGGKTPALKLAFAPLVRRDSREFECYQQKLVTFREDEAINKKAKIPSPAMPTVSQILIGDATIETVIKVMSENPVGSCVFSDELAAFLRRMNQYKSTGDEEEKWLSIWSGDPVVVQRLGRDINRVSDPFCSIIGGIQPGLLDKLAENGRADNGFYHRFLFVFPPLQSNPEWGAIRRDEAAEGAYSDFVDHLIAARTAQTKWSLSEAANDVYGKWFNGMNELWRGSQDENSQGIISKYMNYYAPRLALLLSVVNREDGQVTEKTMRDALVLTDYFLQEIKKTVRRLLPDSQLDRLKEPWKRTLCEKLPDEFEVKLALKIGKEMKISEKAVRNFLGDHSGQRCKIKLFQNTGWGKFRRLFF